MSSEAPDLCGDLVQWLTWVGPVIMINVIIIFFILQQVDRLDFIVVC